MIRIYGASDDLCEIEGVDLDHADGDSGEEERTGRGVAKAAAGGDEIGVIDKDVQFVIGHDEARDGRNAEGLRVWVHYTDLGVWAVTLLPIEEDVPCPWPVRVTFDGYTARAEVDAPDGTPVSYAVVEASEL